MARLGRGLEELLKNSQLKSMSNQDQLKLIQISLIVANPYQPRKEFAQEQIEHLAKSIEKQGLLQPIVVRQVEGRYQLIAGERRHRAMISLGLSNIMAVVKEGVGDQEMQLLSLVENMQRIDLNPIEKALGVRKLIEEFSLKHQEVSDYLGTSRSGITNLLRLLSLPDEVQEALKQGQIDMGHARALVGLDKPLCLKGLEKILSEDLNVRETEKFAQEQKGGFLLEKEQGQQPSEKAPPKPQVPLQITETKPADTGKPHNPSLPSEYESLLKSLQNKGLSLEVKMQDKGGRVTIQFSSFNELDEILAKLH